MQDYTYFIMLVIGFLLLGFFLDTNFNFLVLLLYAESVWTLIYTFICYLASLKASTYLLILALFALSIGGLEFSIGLLILRVYKIFGLGVFSFDIKNSKVFNKPILKNFI